MVTERRNTRREPTASTVRPLLFAISLLSAAALGYEVLLTRLFSIIQWHHFAYMIISVALLGYGAAGTTVTLLRERFADRTHTVFAVCAALFAVFAIASFLLAERLPFNALAFFWDTRQTGYLLVLYLLLLVPFFFAATAICAAYTRYASEAPRLYSFDILGAAAGSLGAIVALFLVSPMTAVKVVGVIGVAAALMVRSSTGRGIDVVCVVLFALGAGIVALPASWLSLVSSEYKDLSQTLQARGAKILAERSSPLGVRNRGRERRCPLSLRAGH